MKSDKRERQNNTLNLILIRINKIDIKINEHIGNDIIIARDSTGIKVSNRGDWIRHKWHIRKGYLKIHVAVDIKEEDPIMQQSDPEPGSNMMWKGAKQSS